MKHLGDITKINWAEVEPVDCVTGGSPCQDLSVAGKRAGLAGERSGLYMEQIRCVKELREKDVRNGRSGKFIRPRYMVWENVPGAFSSNGGKDFAAVLEEAVKIAEPEAADLPVPEKGWPSAGCLYDEMGRWSVAWRVHDAQFWGVPQRRKRISLVCDFGGMSAPEILFERKGMSGDFEQSGTPWKAVAGDAANRAGSDDCEGAIPYTLKIRSVCDGGGNGALIQVDKSGTLDTNNDQYLFQPMNMVLDDQGGQQITVRTDGKAPTLRAEMHGNIPCVLEAAGFKAGQSMAGGIGWKKECAATLSAQCSGTEPTVCVKKAYSIENHPADSRVDIDDSGKVQTLTSGMVTGGGNVPMVLEAHLVYCLQGNGIDRADTARCNGKGWKEDTSYTLNTIDRPEVAYCTDIGFFNSIEDVSPTLLARTYKDPHLVSYPENAFQYIVRRLTPTECERLQGYPDGWTDIGEWVDSKGKKHKEADSPRYKALGNSIALPFWKWLLKRISAQYERNATLGSLFDGIGGFPLCWEQINGKGSARWASEIEEFPMAVTRKRFEEAEE